MKQVSDEWMSAWKTGVDLPKSSEGFTPSCFTTILRFFFCYFNKSHILSAAWTFLHHSQWNAALSQLTIRFGFPSWCCSSQRAVSESISPMNFYWLKFFFVEKITVFLMKALLCFFFFFSSDGVNTFDLEPTNSAPTKTRLMLSPSFLAITDRSLTPSLSSNTWCFPLCNALVIALQTLQYISYFRVNELPENFQVDMKFWCGVRPCCTSVKFWSF